MGPGALLKVMLRQKIDAPSRSSSEALDNMSFYKRYMAFAIMTMSIKLHCKAPVLECLDQHEVWPTLKNLY